MNSRVHPVVIAPSILAADFARLGEEVKRVEQAGADWIHIDVMDGHFVPNITIGAPVVQGIRGATSLPLDVHLMIADPEAYLRDFIDAGATVISLHVEAIAPSKLRSVRLRQGGRFQGFFLPKREEERDWTTNKIIKSMLPITRHKNVRVGVAVNPETDVSWVFPLADHVDFVLFMTVWPGFGGQKFMPEVLPNVRKLRDAFPNLDIQVDGGLNRETAALAGVAGANLIVAGTSVFGASDAREAIGALRKAVVAVQPSVG